mgnify:CR=1 FL=1
MDRVSSDLASSLVRLSSLSRQHERSTDPHPSRAVGNLPFDYTEEQLVEVFSSVGPVVSFRYALAGVPRSLVAHLARAGSCSTTPQASRRGSASASTRTRRLPLPHSGTSRASTLAVAVSGSTLPTRTTRLRPSAARLDQEDRPEDQDRWVQVEEGHRSTRGRCRRGSHCRRARALSTTLARPSRRCRPGSSSTL